MEWVSSSAPSRGTEGRSDAVKKLVGVVWGDGKPTSIDALSSALACARARKAENEEESRFEEEPVRGLSFLEMVENLSNDLGLDRVGFIVPPFLHSRNPESFGVATGC
jgi:hypothetical protein